MDKQNFIKFFGPPEGNVDVPLIYHTSLQFDQVQKGYPWREIREAALNYYSKPSYGDVPLISWEETISTLLTAAKQEREKEINLLGNYIEEKTKRDWLNLSWKEDQENLLSSYKGIIEKINDFLGNKEFFEFAKQISALKAERKRMSKEKRKQYEEALSLVSRFAKEVKNETIEQVFKKGAIFSKEGMVNLFDTGSDAEIIKVINDEISKGFFKGLSEGKNKLVTLFKEHNIHDPGIINFMDSLSENEEFISILETYSTQVPGIRSLRDIIKNNEVKEMLKQEEFNDKNIEALAIALKEGFEVKTERTSNLISKVAEEVVVQAIAKSTAITNGELNLVKNLKNEKYSLDSMAIITEDKDMRDAVKNFIDKSKAKDKIEARKEYQDLMIELEKIAEEAEKIPKGYTVINFNTKTYIRDNKFSAGTERKIQDIDFMLSEITNTEAFTNRLAQFGVGFLFNSKEMGKDEEIVQTLGKLLIFIGGFLFEGFKSVGSDLHSGVNMLYLNHYMVPFSFVLFSLANSLGGIKNGLLANGIKSRSGGGSDTKSVQIFDKDTTAHLNLRIKKTMMNKDQRYDAYDHNISTSDPKHFAPGWAEQSEKALNAITIEASFLNEFHKRMNNLLN